MLNVLIDIRSLETGHSVRGIGYYVSNLVPELLLCKEINWILLTYSSNNPLLRNKSLLADNKIIYMPKPKLRSRFWWIADQVNMPRYINKSQADIFFSPDTNLPIWHTYRIHAKTIATIHDLIPLVMRKQYKLPLDRLLEQKIKFAGAKHADRIITVSQHSKNDIVKYLNVKPSIINTVYEAADSRYKPVSPKIRNAIQNKYSQRQSYFLIIGDYYGKDPRKNYQIILKAYKLLLEKKTYKGGLTPILLFVGRCGGDNNEYSIIKEQAKRLKIADHIVFTGFVPDVDLPAIVASAEALLYPSRYEGFGLPVVQAMASGCPVITTKLTSIPEVAGQSAIYCEIDNHLSLVESIQELLSNRQDYIKAGLKQSEQFSWIGAAQSVARIINKI